jgi:hypothetical protein
MNSVEFIVKQELVLDGRFEKSELLSNQQETLKSKGSSETYTQSSLLAKKQTEDSANPTHKKSYDQKLIEWFVGFAEGNGSFVTNTNSNRVSFIITQKDPKVLYYIKKELGYGRVYYCKDTYYRYIVSDSKNIQYLIKLFSGRLILSKTIKRFEEWVKAYALYYKCPQQIIQKYENKISMKSAWLSGFIDAEGCFSAIQRSNKTNFRMRFTIKQKAEFEVFKQLTQLGEDNVKLGHIKQIQDIVIFTIDSNKSLKYLINYLENNTLHSNKNIAYKKWLKLYRVLEDGGRGKDYETIKRMAQSIDSGGE